MLHLILRLFALALVYLSFAAHAAYDFTPTSDFTDNGDGTVTHKLTGLTWMHCSMGQTWTGSICSGTASTHNFDQAKALTSTFAGHSDWRLPNPWELATIVDYDIDSPSINRVIFPSTLSSVFWSGFPYANDSSSAWYVNFNYGNVYGNYRSYNYSVRLVRGGQSIGILTTPTVEFTDHGDGTATHKKTGLSWKRCSEGQTWTGVTCSGTASGHTYDQAVALTATFASKADWRVPNIQELLSIVEYGANGPAINTEIFPNTPSSGFWSGSPDANNLSYVWLVNFGVGDAYSYYRYNSNAVRLVRGTQSATVLPPPTSFLLSVTKSGSGTVTGSGISCGSDCSESFAAGTSVTLSASASAASGYRFAGWSGDCVVSGDRCSVTMSAARNVTANFTAIDTTPDSFSFDSVTNARRAATITSDPIVVRGIDAPTSISVSGGEYAINDGAFTAEAGKVKLGNRVSVRLTSPSSFNQTGSATLTIGGVSASFDVTTLAFTPVAATSEVFSNPQTTSVTAKVVLVTEAAAAPLQLATAAPDNAIVVLATDQPVQVVSGSATLSYTRREDDTSFRVQTIGGTKSLSVASGSVDIAASASNVTIPVAGGSSSGATLVTQSADTRLIAGRDQNRRLVLAVVKGPVLYRGITRNGNGSRALPNSFTIYPGEAVVTDNEGTAIRLRLGGFTQNQGQGGDFVTHPRLANAALKIPLLGGTSQRFNNEALTTIISRALARKLGFAISNVSLTQDSQSGVLTLTVKGKVFRYLPVGDLAIDAGTVRAVSTSETAANLTQILDEGLSFAVAPALSYTDLEANLILIDPQSTLEILGDGALLATVNGSSYVAQPAPELVPGGTGCPKFDSLDGQLAVCDASGYRQILYPAFADTDNVIADFAAEVPTLTVQNAGLGTYTATIPDTTLTAIPDIQLLAPPESQAGKLWWQEQDKIYVRYKNDTSQAFSVR